ncbi:hypothetical protein GOV04_05710 [Candidatus Woesearchaeota archaeon]|nr:hypothetical protein [Candidatus Woesearchaeota archaeon]
MRKLFYVAIASVLVTGACAIRPPMIVSPQAVKEFPSEPALLEETIDHPELTQQDKDLDNILIAARAHENFYNARLENIKALASEQTPDYQKERSFFETMSHALNDIVELEKYPYLLENILPALSYGSILSR